MIIWASRIAGNAPPSLTITEGFNVFRLWCINTRSIYDCGFTKMSVSFSFTKKSSNKPLIRADDSLEEKKDYVVSVEGKQIQR